MGDNLAHVYDAVKRREYYLKTRQLKGRTTGTNKSSSTRKTAAVKPPAKTRAQRQAARRKHLEAEVEALKARLERLRKVLEQEVAKAKARSGQKTSKSSDDKKSTTSKASTSSEKLTAQQKAAKAKAAKEYREKNKDLLLEDQVKSLREKVKTIQERIKKMRKDGSVGAKTKK